MSVSLHRILQMNSCVCVSCKIGWELSKFNAILTLMFNYIMM